MAAFAQAFPVNLNCCPHNAGVCMELLAAFAQRVWEGALGRYPVTMAFLTLTQTLVVAGVNQDCVKVDV